MVSTSPAISRHQSTLPVDICLLSRSAYLRALLYLRRKGSHFAYNVECLGLAQWLIPIILAIQEQRLGRMWSRLTWHEMRPYLKNNQCTCNPSYSGSRDQEDSSSKPAWANSSRDLILKKKSQKEQTE
jgi:hypothetical protein